MTLTSMTGFAELGGSEGPFRWRWQVKSVNHKALDIRLKLPSFLETLEARIKTAVRKACTRGAVFVTLDLDREEGADDFTVNEGRLEALLDIVARYADRPGVAPARLDGLLAVKGVVEQQRSQVDKDSLEGLSAALMESFDACLVMLSKGRRDEGARLAAMLGTQLDDMSELKRQAEEAAGDRVAAMHRRFREQLDRLGDVAKPVSDERLAQEVAIMAVKADIREELDRLDSHFAQARDLVAGGSPAGRQLDFLSQELNREANTLCAKSGDVALTRIGLALKGLIDQFREQVQNIE